MDQLLAGLRAAAESTRLRILAVLSRTDLTVTELTQVLGQSQPRVSRHLKLLCDAGLLTRFQEGTWVFYRLADEGPGADLAQAVLARVPGDELRLEVRDESGYEVTDRYFEIADGELRTTLSFMPSMLAMDETAIRQDCLCYLMERYPGP